MKGRAEVIEQVPKPYRDMVRQALRRGWTIERGRLKHAKLVSPQGTTKIPLPSGHKDRGHLPKKIESQIRRAEEAEGGVHIE